MAVISSKLRDLLDRGVAEAKDHHHILYGIAGGAALLSAWSLYRGKVSYKNKPTSFELGGGSIHATKVQAEFTNYSKAYGTTAGEGIRKEERVNTVELVCYSLCMRRDAPARALTRSTAGSRMITSRMLRHRISHSCRSHRRPERACLLVGEHLLQSGDRYLRVGMGYQLPLLSWSCRQKQCGQ